MQECLQFGADNRFKIVQFTDIHWHNGEPADHQTQQLIELVLTDQKPDLIMLTGDTLAGGGCADPQASMAQVAGMLERFATPWAAVFGNHDDEGGVSRTKLMEVMCAYEHCVAEAGPTDIFGVGNYVLPICGAGDSAVHFVLYCLDSGSYAATDIGGYDWIKRDQIEWYISHSRGFQQQHGGPIPALAFFHIPLPEYDEVWDHHTCYGYKHEAVCCPRVNTGLFAAMHEMGDVLGTFVGHDHIDDYEGDLYGIRLCYCRGTGFHTYGREGFPRGARIIQVTQGERSFDTWQQLADGTVLQNPPEHAPTGRTLSQT